VTLSRAAPPGEHAHRHGVESLEVDAGEPGVVAEHVEMGEPVLVVDDLGGQVHDRRAALHQLDQFIPPVTISPIKMVEASSKSSSKRERASGAGRKGKNE